MMDKYCCENCNYAAQSMEGLFCKLHDREVYESNSCTGYEGEGYPIIRDDGSEC